MINHTIFDHFVHKKFRHLPFFILILSALVWLIASCSAEEQPSEPPAHEEAVRETSDQAPTVQIEPEKPNQTKEIQLKKRDQF